MGEKDEQVNAQTPTIPPLWEGWSRPTKPSEALDLGASYAEMEGVLCTGELFKLRGLPSESDDDLLNRPHGRWSPEYVKRDDWIRDRTCGCKQCLANDERKKKLEAEGLTCNDVQACSVGILIMATLDGPAVNAYFYKARLDELLASLGIKKLPDHDGEFVEKLLVEDNIGGPACLFLHAGMARLIRKRLTAEEIEKAETYPKTPDDNDEDDPVVPNDPIRMIEEYIAGPPLGPRGGKYKGGPAKWRRLTLEYHKASIIGINDNDFNNPDDVDAGAIIPLTPGEQIHNAIYQCFVYGAEYARQYEGRLGFNGSSDA